MGLFFKIPSKYQGLGILANGNVYGIISVGKLGITNTSNKTFNSNHIVLT